MKEPISSYKEYCRVWAEVYKKHAKHCEHNLYSCYVRSGIKDALRRGELRKPKQEIATDEDIVGIYIVRALVAQGMSESGIMEYTTQMQVYVDAADMDHDSLTCMEEGLHILGIDPHAACVFIPNVRNRLRYMWALHGGFSLVPAAD